MARFLLDSNRKAIRPGVFYKLTAGGKKHTGAEESDWGLLVKAIAGVMKPAGAV